MDNSHFDSEWESYVDSLSDGSEPRTLEDIERDWPKQPTAADLLARHIADINRPRQPDAYAGEQELAQMRILHEIQRPVQIKKAATAAEPEFSGEAPAQEGDLAYLLLGGVEGDPDVPAITATRPNSGRAPGASFAKVGGGTRASVLDRPFDELMELVGERASTPGARSLAKSLAQALREIGGGL